MLIYECKYGIKILGDDDDYEKNLIEYGARNMAVVDEENFKEYHYCIDKKNNYWLPNTTKFFKKEHIEAIKKEIKEHEDLFKQWKKQKGNKNERNI